MKIAPSSTIITSLATATVALGITFEATAQTAVEEEFVVIQAGKIITGTGEEIVDGEIVLVDGKVRLVGQKLDYPMSAEIIDARDQVVMPGLVHAHSRAGLTGYNRNGTHANYSVVDDVYLEELDLEALLENGFTTVCLQPPGGGIPGSAAVYRTAGQADDRLLIDPAWLRVSMTNPGSDKNALRGAVQKAKAEIEKVEKARAEWEKKQKEKKAKEEAEKKKNDAEKKKDKRDTDKKDGDNGNNANLQDGGDEKKDPDANDDKKEDKAEEFKPPAMDPSVARLAQVMQDEISLPLLLEVNGAADVLHAVDVMEMDQLEDFSYRLYLRTGFRTSYADAVESLAERGRTMLLVEPTLSSLPDTAIQYNFPAALTAKKITPAFVPSGDSSRELELYRTNIANLVRNGLPRDKALDAMITQPAKFVGINDKLGSIEKDKEGDLVFLDGDPLSPWSKVQRVMILGKTVWEREDN